MGRNAGGWIGRLAAAAVALFGASAAAAQPAPDEAYAKLDALFADFAKERHVPGLVYGVVADGKLVYVKTLGVQDTVAKQPVTADSVFRIASMSKNFTSLAALKLRDAGKLSLEAPVESLAPEVKGWTYPTTDSARVRVRDLATHTGGFVTDDPWGDRQLDMSEAAFSAFLRTGVPFSRSPGLAMEYSNFGYALLGRVVTNAAGRNYADYIEAEILKPLGMAASTYDVRRIPVATRAVGYRWEDGAWKEEPTLGPGAFGAMGGLAVSANDYAKYVAWVLSAWPARDGPEHPVLKRSSIREIVQGENFPSVIRRAPDDADGCDRARTYGMGMIVFADCDLGLTITHSGGLPGYGSNVAMLPERGIGVFAFANLTYAPTAAVVRSAALELVKSGAFPVRTAPPSEGLRQAADAVAKIYAAGDVLAAREALAMNVLLDRDAAHWKAELAPLKVKLGACRAPEPIVTDTAMSATVLYPCERGKLRAQVLLAPTRPMSIQSLRLAVAP